GFQEPFARLFNQGMLHYRGAKMSKSKGNVIAPDEMVERYGAEPVRLYVLYMGPAEDEKEWQDAGIEGMFRFLGRLWRLGLRVVEAGPANGAPEGPLVRKAHETIAKVSDDIERRFQFNTPIAAVIELVNDTYVDKDDPEQAAAVRFAAETAVSLIQPYVPHIAEELWQRFRREQLWKTPWPEGDTALLARDTLALVVQVNGGVRGRVEVPAGIEDDELIARAKELPRVAAHLDRQDVKDTRVVCGR